MCCRPLGTRCGLGSGWERCRQKSREETVQTKKQKKQTHLCWNHLTIMTDNDHISPSFNSTTPFWQLLQWHACDYVHLPLSPEGFSEFCPRKHCTSSRAPCCLYIFCRTPRSRNSVAYVGSVMGAWMKGRNSRHSKIHTKGAAATPLNTLDCWWHFVNFLSICISISELASCLNIIQVHPCKWFYTILMLLRLQELPWLRTFCVGSGLRGFWRLCLDSRSTLDRRQSHGCQPRAQFRSKYTTENHHIYKILIDIIGL